MKVSMSLTFLSAENKGDLKMDKVKCPKCNYEWQSRLEGKLPAECPRCKARLDRIRMKEDNKQVGS